MAPERTYEQRLVAEALALDAIELLCDIMATEGVNQSELARRLGVTPPSIHFALKGKYMPSLATVARMAHAMGYELTFAIKRMPE
ncbi:MAG TPA: helix-turn-helix transcriptional regulator [Acidimicrobiales bacterium]|nr:helix-turn-helix transcriptional regulator [Acidimicrobiales bacterium]